MVTEEGVIFKIFYKPDYTVPHKLGCCVHICTPPAPLCSPVAYREALYTPSCWLRFAVCNFSLYQLHLHICWSFSVFPFLVTSSLFSDLLTLTRLTCSYCFTDSLCGVALRLHLLHWSLLHPTSLVVWGPSFISISWHHFKLSSLTAPLHISSFKCRLILNLWWSHNPF